MGSSFAQRLCYPKCVNILKSRGSENAQSLYDTWNSTLFIVTHHNEDHSIQSECGINSSKDQKEEQLPPRGQTWTDSTVLQHQFVELVQSSMSLIVIVSHYFAVRVCVPLLCGNLGSS